VTRLREGLTLGRRTVDGTRREARPLRATVGIGLAGSVFRAAYRDWRATRTLADAGPAAVTNDARTAVRIDAARLIVAPLAEVHELGCRVTGFDDDRNVSRDADEVSAVALGGGLARVSGAAAVGTLAAILSDAPARSRRRDDHPDHKGAKTQSLHAVGV
jgi:hypothetical protein